MKRKLKWTAVVLAVVLLGFGTALFLWPRDRITAESWRKIQLGMAIDEVEAVLGGPGEKFEEMPLSECSFTIDVPEHEEPWKNPFVKLDMPKLVWFGRHGIIEIGVNRQSRVIYKNFRDQQHSTFIDRLRDWLGW
jgi:hypothetical protein